ncbi:MAG: uridine phosphorylase [Roseitalea sp.]|jgi:uridine phosphorylase|nr:uridine phosphorylase [Roseitalea sp.]MBO6723314.1 uridine phosphorylase [Roseitalea sp.]MBO6741746.1 uridine phosphorylase [Roseitalea sp.]
MKRAWYLGHRADEVAPCAVLVGDPDRIDRIAALMDAPRMLPVKRGLRTVTGGFDGVPVTAVSFGMGAPIATVVMHELADLGTRAFMRIGTAMYFAPAMAGDFLLCEGIASFEGTSASYVSAPDAQTADPALNAVVAARASQAELPLRRGLFATFDAFYRDMFPLEPETGTRVAGRLGEAERRGAIAADMETSALVNAAHALGAGFTSLCIGTVDAHSRDKLDPETTTGREGELFALALGALTRQTQSEDA